MLMLFHDGFTLKEAVEELLQLYGSLIQKVFILRAECLFRGEFRQLIVHLNREGFLQQRLEIPHGTVPVREMERVISRGNHLDQVLNKVLIILLMLDELHLICAVSCSLYH